MSLDFVLRTMARPQAAAVVSMSLLTDGLENEMD